MRYRLAIGVTVLAQLCAQTPPAPPNPTDVAPGGVLQLPGPDVGPAEAAEPKETAPAKPVLEYTGKPVTIPFDCTAREVDDFGMTCSEDAPCPIYAELTEVQPLGDRLFITGNLHNGSTTMYSLLLGSADAGRTWTEPVDRIKSAALDQIQFFDLSTGWISGQLLQTFPRDPFFLLTTDGGKTWRRRPVLAEPRIALIDQFWFDSRTTGSLVIDLAQGAEGSARYQKYETQTGGESWSIRSETSDEPKLTNSPKAARDAGWRIRPDGKLKANVVEHQVGSRWQTVAAFLVQAAACQPSLTPLAPPPAPLASLALAP